MITDVYPVHSVVSHPARPVQVQTAPDRGLQELWSVIKHSFTTGHHTYYVAQPNPADPDRPYSIRIGDLGKNALVLRVINDSRGPVTIEGKWEMKVTPESYRVRLSFDELRALVEKGYQLARAGRLTVMEFADVHIDAPYYRYPAHEGYRLLRAESVGVATNFHRYTFGLVLEA